MIDSSKLIVNIADAMLILCFCHNIGQLKENFICNCTYEAIF